MSRVTGQTPALSSAPVDEGADGGGALRHPGAGIEKLGGIAERRVIERNRRAAHLLQLFDRLGVEGGVRGIAEELERLGHTEPESLSIRERQLGQQRR